jgi:hypothetical protein
LESSEAISFASAAHGGAVCLVDAATACVSAASKAAVTAMRSNRAVKDCPGMNFPFPGEVQGSVVGLALKRAPYNECVFAVMQRCARGTAGMAMIA